MTDQSVTWYTAWEDVFASSQDWAEVLRMKWLRALAINGGGK